MHRELCAHSPTGAQSAQAKAGQAPARARPQAMPERARGWAMPYTSTGGAELTPCVRVRGRRFAAAKAGEPIEKNDLYEPV